MARPKTPATRLFALSLALSSVAFPAAMACAGANPNVTLPLHARISATGSCTQFSPVNCITVQPTVNVLGSTDIVVYLLLYNYTAAAGVQTAFDWDPSWVLNDVLFNCRAGQINATLPAPGVPGGPNTGTASTAFTCVNGGALAAIGRLVFTSGPQGCLFQVQSSYPFGDHVVDCQNGIDQINPNSQQLRLGRICVGQGGLNACFVEPAVEPATWGAIKAAFE